MHKRFLTYDLRKASTDEYQDLYDLIDTYKNIQITESTYEIMTDEDWEVFKRKFFRVTHNGDNVKVIVRTDDTMQVWTIR